jgi:hypothetical protein
VPTLSVISAWAAAAAAAASSLTVILGAPRGRCGGILAPSQYLRNLDGQAPLAGCSLTEAGAHGYGPRWLWVS